jgi:hypothetical protein
MVRVWIENRWLVLGGRGTPNCSKGYGITFKILSDRSRHLMFLVVLAKYAIMLQRERQSH